MLAKNQKRKRPSGRPGCRWENKTERDLEEIHCDGFNLTVPRC